MLEKISFVEIEDAGCNRFFDLEARRIKFLADEIASDHTPWGDAKPNKLAQRLLRVGSPASAAVSRLLPTSRWLPLTVSC